MSLTGFFNQWQATESFCSGHIGIRTASCAAGGATRLCDTDGNRLAALGTWKCVGWHKLNPLLICGEIGLLFDV